MSTSANPAPEEKKRGNLLSRISTILRKKDGSKRFSLSGPPAAAAAAATTTTTPSAAGPSTTKASEPTPAVEPTAAPDGPQPLRILRSQIDAERANKLGQRFKLPKLEAHEFLARPDKEALRVEKPIRMRIHRTCHVCQATFGGNKICVSCEHPRCSKCPRYPTKKLKTEGAKGKENDAFRVPGEGYIEPDTYWGLREKHVLTLPGKNGGQHLVRKKPVQRVRRTCHECSTLFPGGAKICPNCEHVRCTDCPRNPAKKKKFPDGYPGDAFSATSRAPLKYSCHHCLKVFPAIPHPETPEGLAASSDAPPKCVRCDHEKCTECPRAPIVKVEPAFDPEVLRSVEAKLAALNVGGSAQAVDA